MSRRPQSIDSLRNSLDAMKLANEAYKIERDKLRVAVLTALNALKMYQVLSCVGGGAYDPECADDKVGYAIEQLRAALVEGK